MKKKRFFISLLWRSFFLQSIWNFERLQNIGFAFGLMSFLKKLYPDPEKRKEALLRHITFFNTHPYMAGIVFGLVACQEEELAEGKPVTPNSIAMLKNSIAGPLAAIGDTFFWATWRPFTTLLAISLTLFFYRYETFHGTWFAPIVFITVYNLVHLPFRYWSLRLSYFLRSRIVDIIANLEFRYAVELVRFAGLVVLTVTVVYYFWAFGRDFQERIVYLIVFVMALFAGTLRISPTFVFYGAVLFGIGLVLIQGR